MQQKPTWCRSHRQRRVNETIQDETGAALGNVALTLREIGADALASLLVSGREYRDFALSSPTARSMATRSRMQFILEVFNA